MSISYLLICFRHSHEVYEYHQKSIDSVRPWAPVGGISVKLVNPIRETRFFSSYFKLCMCIWYYGTHVYMRFYKGRVTYGILKKCFLINDQV